jgi:uncharacterized membrane protein
MLLAVATYEWFKTVHVLAVVMWVGGGVMLTLLALMTIALRDPVRLVQFTRQVAFLGGTYFPPLSLLVLGFGFGLVENGHWGYHPAWIQIGIVGWAVSFVTGAGYLGPQSKRLARMLEDRPPEHAGVQALIQRILFVARLDSVLLLFVTLDMVAKPWS